MFLEEFCCLLASTFPKFICTVLILWGYYATTFKVDLVLISNVPLKIFIFAMATILLVFCMILYYLVVALGPGSPLEYSMLCREDYHPGDTISPPPFLIGNSVTVKENGRYRFCQKCKVWKPDRCHHCSACNKCILRMDHHCPWFGECIGFKNYKFFVQFLIYSTFFTMLVTIVTGWADYGFLVSEKIPTKYFSFHILFAFFISVMFSLCLLIFSMFTVFQLLQNRTTVESYISQNYKSHKNSRTLGNLFDLGTRRNWCSVMGDSVAEWVLPIRKRRKSNNYLDDGLEFEVNQRLYKKLQEEADMQQRLSDELENYRARQQQIRADATKNLELQNEIPRDVN